MPRYNEFLYNSATYGDKGKLVFSAEPMVATAIDYNWVDVSYSSPDGGTDGYVGFRIVRSQDGYPETEDDGVILYELFGININPDGRTIHDNPAHFIPLAGLSSGSVAATLQEGQFAYYRAWVLKTPSGSWVPAGDCYTLVPKKHTLSSGYAVKSTLQGTQIVDTPVIMGALPSTHDRFMSYIPTVFTSISNSILDERNPNEFSGNTGDTGAQDNSLLSTFLSAFSFTIDEMMTFAVNTLPPADGGQFTSPAILALQSSQFNVPADSLGVSKTQKRLVRDSIRNYSRKGTLKGLREYVQDVTNYSATVTESGNKILNHESSTFDIKGWAPGDAVGDWLVTSYSGTTPTATITVDATQTTAAVATAIDTTYSMKAVTTASNATISLGSQAPITKGIPVIGGVLYRLSYQGKITGSSGSVSATITWYDNLGNVVVPDAVGDHPTDPSAAMTTSFARTDFTWIAPLAATYATIQLLFSAANTYWIDMVMLYEAQHATVTFASGDGTTVSYEGPNSFKVGDAIFVRGVTPTSYNFSQVVTGITYNSRKQQTGFTVAGSAKDIFIDGGVASKFESSPAYSEARGVLVTLNPSRTNYSINPSFEGSAANWTSTNATTTNIANGVGALYSGPIGARTSSYRARVTATGTASLSQSVGTTDHPLPRNNKYTFSIYVRSSTGSTASPLVLSNGLFITYTDGSTTNTVSQSVSLTTDWQRVSVSIWVPDNGSNTVLNYGLTGWVAGQYIEVDAAQVEIGNTPSDYFDGSMTSTGCAWTLGSSYSTGSYSVKYVNLNYRLNRLYQGISGYLPINTPWAVQYTENSLSPQQKAAIS